MNIKDYSYIEDRETELHLNVYDSVNLNYILDHYENNDTLYLEHLLFINHKD